jgi:hypothetical protein
MVWPSVRDRRMTWSGRRSGTDDDQTPGQAGCSPCWLSLFHPKVLVIGCGSWSEGTRRAEGDTITRSHVTLRRRSVHARLFRREPCPWLRPEPQDENKGHRTARETGKDDFDQPQKAVINETLFLVFESTSDSQRAMARILLLNQWCRPCFCFVIDAPFLVG